ncbi:MAG: arcadin 1 [Candidatus Bathyarchaeota archaeon]|nr:arcadin 1 [Candidatus Bathyarchaeota archaeon]
METFNWNPASPKEGVRFGMITTTMRLKVSSVRGVQDPEGRGGYRIEFVEVRDKPPVVIPTPSEMPKEMSSMVVQISKGIQQAIPGGRKKQYELQKLTFLFTGEELEAFALKPYPNQIYELTISTGTLSFKQV